MPKLSQTIETSENKMIFRPTFDEVTTSALWETPAIYNYNNNNILVSRGVTKNLVREKNLSGRTIFSRPNLVRPDHF